mgnify:CR=1 FL=1
MAEASVHGGIYSVFWKDPPACFFAYWYHWGRGAEETDHGTHLLCYNVTSICWGAFYSKIDERTIGDATEWHFAGPIGGEPL